MNGRRCTVCSFMGKDTQATHVAGNAQGLQWFECGQHGPTDYAEGPRTSLVALDRFRLLGGNYHPRDAAQLKGKFARARAALKAVPK